MRKYWACPDLENRELVYYCVSPPIRTYHLVACLYLQNLISLQPSTNAQQRFSNKWQGDAVDVRTNCAFLLSAFLVIELRYTPEDAWKAFASIPGNAFATYRDVSTGPQDYDLTIMSCLKGITRAMALGWYHPDKFDG